MTTGQIIRWSTAGAVAGVAAVAAWPAVALVGSYELFMTIICGARQPDDRASGAEHVPEAVSGTDRLRIQAAEAFGADVAAGRLPSIRAIRSRLRVGQPRAAGTRVSGRTR
jgi:hypothetical protein